MPISEERRIAYLELQREAQQVLVLIDHAKGLAAYGADASAIDALKTQIQTVRATFRKHFEGA